MELKGRVPIVYISGRESTAGRLSRMMAQMLADAEAAEQALPVKRGEWNDQIGKDADRVATYVIAAIYAATAWAEATVNEVYIASAEGSRDFSSVRLPQRAQELLRNVWLGWHREPRSRDPNAVAKAREALKALGLAHPFNELPSRPDFQVLCDLRDSLTHAKPEFLAHGMTVDVDEGKRLDSLRKNLDGKFQLARGVPHSAIYLWEQVLGCGCATWATNTARAFIKEWEVAMTSAGQAC
jgi:hypothetical protein